MSQTIRHKIYLVKQRTRVRLYKMFFFLKRFNKHHNMRQDYLSGKYVNICCSIREEEHYCVLPPANKQVRHSLVCTNLLCAISKLAIACDQRYRWPEISVRLSFICRTVMDFHYQLFLSGRCVFRCVDGSGLDNRLQNTSFRNMSGARRKVFHSVFRTRKQVALSSTGSKFIWKWQNQNKV